MYLCIYIYTCMYIYYIIICIYYIITHTYKTYVSAAAQVAKQSDAEFDAEGTAGNVPATATPDPQ